MTPGQAWCACPAEMAIEQRAPWEYLTQISKLAGPGVNSDGHLTVLTLQQSSGVDCSPHAVWRAACSAFDHDSLGSRKLVFSLQLARNGERLANSEQVRRGCGQNVACAAAAWPHITWDPKSEPSFSFSRCARTLLIDLVWLAAGWNCPLLDNPPEPLAALQAMVSLGCMQAISHRIRAHGRDSSLHSQRLLKAARRTARRITAMAAPKQMLVSS